MLKIFIFVTLLFVFKQALSKKARIAIVGAGIGGSSCSYFLRDHLKYNIDIDLYEAHEVGGRLASTTYEEEIYELGGHFLHARNKYMNMFREKFELTACWDSNASLAIRDSSGLKFCSSNYKIVTYALFIWKYGIMSAWRLRNFINHLLDQFDKYDFCTLNNTTSTKGLDVEIWHHGKIYLVQQKGDAFATVEKLFEAAAPNILPYFKTSVMEGFRTHVSMNKNTIEDLVRSTIRVNYGQSTDVHMFLGSVSASCMFSPGRCIQGGVRQVPELLAPISDANFLNNRVERIVFVQQTKEYVVESVSKSTSEQLVKNYDLVVIANPITADSKTPIKFENFDPPIAVAGRYQRIVATLVAGDVNPSYFEWSKNYVPDIIIDNDDPVFNSISKSWSSANAFNQRTYLWKVFSQRPLTDDELSAMFQTPKVIKMKDWLAYPKYEKLNVEDGNFILHDGLFYVNAIEWAASAMEMSIIGAKNVALLVEKKLRSTGQLEQVGN